MHGQILSHQHTRQWWKEATIYQIYPASFKDSNSDGIGDIPGIISKLPYLASLGIDGIWLSPHYASPQIDMGYDISDFEDIYPPYGTLQDCQDLIDACHAHGLKLIFDLVINHTSDQHKWFQESRSSKSNPKRDWYIWKPPRGYNADGSPIPPNNWRSNFSVPAWEFDSLTNEYYLHLWATEMPDLNWENEECRRAIYESSMHFWLRRGIDGFRVDVVNHYSKPQDFPNAPVTDPSQYTQPANSLVSNGPRMHEWLSEMNKVLSQYTAHGSTSETPLPVMTVGELPNTPNVDAVRAYVSAAAKQMDMVFNFDTVMLGKERHTWPKAIPYTVADIKRTLSMWQDFVNGTDAWTTVFLENHDQGRSISRFGDDSTEALRVRSGKMWAMVLATMTGTLFLYQGQEIGMTNIPPAWGLEEYLDVRSVNFVNGMKKRGASTAELEAMKQDLRIVARDNARIPFQWDSSANAGFSETGRPWMRVHDNYEKLNVKNQETDPGSLLSFWKSIIKFRKQETDLFIYGVFENIEINDTEVFMFTKTSEDGARRTLTVANLSGKPRELSLPPQNNWELVLCNMDGDRADSSLEPWEARVFKAVQ